MQYLNDKTRAKYLIGRIRELEEEKQRCVLKMKENFNKDENKYQGYKREILRKQKIINYCNKIYEEIKPREQRSTKRLVIRGNASFLS